MNHPQREPSIAPTSRILRSFFSQCEAFYGALNEEQAVSHSHICDHEMNDGI